MKAPKRKVMNLKADSAKPDEVTDREWDRFLQAITGTTVEWVLITPPLAQKWLDLNTKNRKLSGTGVSLFAGQIATGDWMANGQTIIFGRNGKLLDGQHRLAAIIQAGRAIACLVVRGVDDDAFKTIDRGRPRSIADILHMQGEMNSVIAASACRYLRSYWDTGRFGKGKGRIAFAEVEGVIHKHPHLRESISYVTTIHHAVFTMGSPSLMTALHYLFASVDDENCAYFFDRLISGAELAKDSPILHLRNVIMKNNQSLQKYPIEHIGRFTLKAWNLFCARERVAALKVGEEEDLRILESPKGAIR